MKKVLVVENHPITLQFLGNLLEKEGYDVTTVKDGLSALSILEALAPDIIVSDLIMPNIDGEKLCRITRSMASMKDVVFIILSAIAVEDDTDFLGFGANACIAKGPFSEMGKQLLAVLQQLSRDESPRLIENKVGIEYHHRREITEELLTIRKHTDTILEHISEGIVEITRDGRIIFVNAAAVTLFSLSEERMLNTHVGDIFVERDRSRVEALMEATVVTPHVGIDNPLTTLNGKEALIDAIPVERKDSESLVLIVDDISERKRIEAQLQEAQKMETVATLAGGIAHEFNNALSGIIGNIDLLNLHLPESEDIRKYTRAMGTSADRMVNLTSQLLAYAKGGKYQPRDIALNKFIEDAIPIIQYGIDPKIRVEVVPSPGTIEVRADVTQMQMVLSAILANASESIDEGGHIKISYDIENIDSEFVRHHPGLAPGTYVCVTVEDNGEGMDDEVRARIFEPFYSTKFPGSGLGMASVWGIISAHDGWVSVYSELGEGTVVRVYLPARGSKVEEHKAPAVEVIEGTGTILIVEDEEVVMDIGVSMLRRLGYSPLAAKTGGEAIDLAKTFDGHIDAALLDVKLPDMRGHNVYPAIMETRPDLKVIVCSGYDLDGPAHEIVEAGAQDFIQKPYTLASLSEKLHTVLNG